MHTCEAASVAGYGVWRNQPYHSAAAAPADSGCLLLPRWLNKGRRSRAIFLGASFCHAPELGCSSIGLYVWSTRCRKPPHCAHRCACWFRNRSRHQCGVKQCAEQGGAAAIKESNGFAEQGLLLTCLYEVYGDLLRDVASSRCYSLHMLKLPALAQAQHTVVGHSSCPSVALIKCMQQCLNKPKCRHINASLSWTVCHLP